MSSNNTMKSSLNISSEGSSGKKVTTVSESSIPNTVSQTPPKPTIVVDEVKKSDNVAPTPKPVVAATTTTTTTTTTPVADKKPVAATTTPVADKKPVAAATTPVETTKTNVPPLPLPVKTVTEPVNKAKLLVKKLDPNAVLPERKSDGAAGYDICCLDKRVVIPPNSQKLISTGLSFTVPDGTYGQLASRSGLSVKGVTVGAGVIDRDYTGEVKVLLFNHSSDKVYINEKDRIAQLIIKKIELPVVEEVDSLETTIRGDNGFGSTDKK